MQTTINKPSKEGAGVQVQPQPQPPGFSSSLEHYPIYILCVDKSAGLPDLAAGRVCDVAHLHHGVGELLEESLRVGPVLVDGVGGRVAGDAGPHLLVGVEEALALDEGLDVGVVEDGGGVAVHALMLSSPSSRGHTSLSLLRYASDDGLYLDVSSKSP